MKKIQLTQGKVALVDDADFEWLNQWKWYARQCKGQHTFYAARNAPIGAGKRKTLLMHTLIIPVINSGDYPDHIDLTGLNNQKYNLRIANKSQNNANKNSSTGSYSKHRGVSYHTRDCVWQVNLGKDGKQIYAGSYKTEKEAALIYNERAVELHGEFAKINIL